MKIVNYHILTEDEDISRAYDIVSGLSTATDAAKRLSKNTGLKLQSDKDVDHKNPDYIYNINPIKFRLFSQLHSNDVLTTREEHNYAFYDNILHILGTKSGNNNMLIYFDYPTTLTELTNRKAYKIKEIEGNYQSISHKEHFEYFELIDPKEIRLSKKINSGEQKEKNQKGKVKEFVFKPNTFLNIVFQQKLGGGSMLTIDGEARVEAISNKTHKYKIYTKNAIYTLTLNKPFTTEKGVIYEVPLITKTDGNGTNTANNIFMKNNETIKYSY